MKTYQFIVLACMALLVFQPVKSQSLEKDKSFELSKDARKGEMISFRYDEEKQMYYVVFMNDKRKKDIVEIYQFDYDFNLKANEVLEIKEAKDKYKGAFVDVEIKETEWDNPKAVRVDAKAMKGLVLTKGYISRETNWYNDVPYYEYNFVEEESVTPTLDFEIDLPAATPPGIARMIRKGANKIFMEAYATDEPRNEAPGRFHLEGADFWGQKRDFLDASGDIVVLGRQEWAQNNKMTRNYYILKFSAKDLSELNRVKIDFEYENQILFHKVFRDNTLGVLFIPQDNKKRTLPEDPNPQHFTFIKMSKEGEIEQRVSFESNARNYAVKDMVLTESGDVYMYGLANAKNNDSYKVDFSFSQKFDNLQVVKISQGKIGYVASANLDQMEAKLKKPANQKKADSYPGKKMYLYKNLTITQDGHVIIGGETEDHDAVHYFQFSPEGQFDAQYVINAEEKLKERGIEQEIIENVDGKSLTVYIGEYVGDNDLGEMKYPRMGTIDVEKATVSAMKAFGYGKKQEYFLDVEYPFTGLDDGKKITILGRDKKNKEIWFGRVALAQ